MQGKIPTLQFLIPYSIHENKYNTIHKDTSDHRVCLLSEKNNTRWRLTVLFVSTRDPALIGRNLQDEEPGTLESWPYKT